MEKTKIKTNICGVEIAVAADAEPEAARRIAEAVRTRMQDILRAPYAATVEKAAVITAMNLCEELARCKAALAEKTQEAETLSAELKEIGGAKGLKARLAQTEAKLKIAEAQLERLSGKKAEKPEKAEKPAGEAAEAAPAAGAVLRNPVRPDIDEQVGFVSFFAKE